MLKESEDEQKTQIIQEFYNFKQNLEIDMFENLANLDNLIYRIKQFIIDLHETLTESKILTSLSTDYEHFITPWESPKNEKTHRYNFIE